MRADGSVGLEREGLEREGETLGHRRQEAPLIVLWTDERAAQDDLA